MIGRALASLLLVCAFNLCLDHSDWCYGERTQLASAAQEKEAASQELLAKGKTPCTTRDWKTHQAETSQSCAVPSRPPHLEYPRSASFYPEKNQNDVALPSMWHPQFAKEERVQRMWSSLARSMGTAQAQVQKPASQEESATTGVCNGESEDDSRRGNRRCQGLDHASTQSSVDHVNSTSTSQRGKYALRISECIADPASARSTQTSSQAGETRRAIPDCRGDQDHGKHQGFEIFGFGNLTRDGREAQLSGSQSQRDISPEISVACTSEQARPCRIQGRCSSTEASPPRSRMEELYAAHVRQDHISCTNVRIEPRRVDGDLQHSASRITPAQSRDERGFQAKAWDRRTFLGFHGSAGHPGLISSLDPHDPRQAGQDSFDLRRRDGTRTDRSQGRGVREQDNTVHQGSTGILQAVNQWLPQSCSGTPEERQISARAQRVDEPMGELGAPLLRASSMCSLRSVLKTTRDLNCRQNHVTFCDTVEVNLLHDGHNKCERFQVHLCLDTLHQRLRTGWHLDGQISCWHDMCSSLEAPDLFLDETFSMMDAHEGLESPSQSSIPESVVGIGGLSPNEDSMDTHENFAAVQESCFAQARLQFTRQMPAKKYVEVWFVRKNHHHLCLQSRRVKLDQAQDERSFEELCRAVWYDLLGSESTSLLWISPQPQTMMSTLAHVILIQGNFADSQVVMVRSDAFPILRKHRVIAVDRGASAFDVTFACQVGRTCSRQNVRCVLQKQTEYAADSWHDEQIPLLFPGDLLDLWFQHFDSDSDDDASDDDHDDTDRSTCCPDEESSDDETSLMSGAPHMSWQVDPSATYPWEHLDFPDLPSDAEEEEEADAYDVTAEIQQQFETIRHWNEQSSILLVTFGVGVVELGRRDVLTFAQDARAMMHELHQLWQDVGQFGDIEVHMVQPQPDLQIARSHMIFVVSIRYPNVHPATRAALVVQSCTDDPTKHRPPFAARLPERTSGNGILRSLELERDLHPMGIRDHVTKIKGRILPMGAMTDIWNGDLCEINILAYPHHVRQASAWMQNAEAFFVDLRTAVDSEPLQYVHCRVHGTSPQNNPLGFRDLRMPLHRLYSTGWNNDIEALWPFRPGNIQIAFVFAEDTRRHPNDPYVLTFHFVISYDVQPGTRAVLINQVIVALDDFQLHEGYEARNIQENAQDHEVLALLPRELFQNHPNMAQQIQRSRPDNVYRSGDVILIRLHTRSRTELLTILLDLQKFQDHIEPEVTSLIQIRANKIHADPFQEICNSLLDATETLETSDDTRTPDKAPKTEVNANLRMVTQTHSEPSGHSDVTADHRCLSQLNDILTELRSPWTGLCTTFDWVPRNHPMVDLALQCTSQTRSTSNVFHIFTDGSYRGPHTTCDGHKHPATAAWAFVVLCEVSGPKGASYVRVGYSTDTLDDSIGPCRLSSQNAEATAIIAMCEYILSLPSDIPLQLHCHFDSTSVGWGAFGFQQLPAEQGCHADRPHLARVLVPLVEQRSSQVQPTHVHSHEGNPFNEMADGIAAHRRCGNMPPKQPVLRSGRLNSHVLRDWAWVQVNPREDMPDLATVLCNAPSDASTGWEDRTLQAAKGTRTHSPVTFKFQMATMNVSTLCYQEERYSASSFKTRELLQQCSDQGIQFVAVQESRARFSQIVQEGGFVRLISQGENGHAGVKLWIDVESIFAQTGYRLNIDKDICTWHHSSRLLAVDITCDIINISICVIYAPQSGRPESEIVEWWQNFRTVLDARPTRLPMIWLGDMNAKIGSVVTPEIGDHGADLEDVAGQALREACSLHRMSIPSTFSAWHIGQTWTFVNPSGFRSRLDYIAVEEAILPGVLQSQVNSNIDAMNGALDHLPLCLELQMTEIPDTANKLSRTPLYDRDKARSCKTQMQWDPMEDVPRCPWNCDVNRQWAVMRDALQDHMAKWYPRPKRRKRQLYIASDTWTTVCNRKDMRQHHRQLQREQRTHTLQALFDAWKGRPVEPKTFRFQCHILNMQDALTLKARQDLDQRFRQQKRADWKAWIVHTFDSKILSLQHAKGPDIFKLLQPKKMISKAAGHHRRSLPGYRNDQGQWVSGKRDIALAWQRQFGHIEHADPSDMQSLIEQSIPSCQPRSIQDLLDVPTIYQVETAIRQMSDRKAPGLDNLGAEVYQFNVPRTAQRVFPLLVKSALRKQPLPEMSGGWLVPLHKGKGSKQDMQGFRAILLEPTLGRILSRSWRPKLESALAQQAMHMQYGGRKGLAIEGLHLQTRLWYSNATAAKLALSIVYVDIRSAFYSVAKQFLVGCKEPATEIQDLCHRLRIPDSACQAFLDHVMHLDLLSKATGSSTITDSIAATLKSTWFAIENGQQIQAPTTGSRPGDPLADVLYGLVMSEFLSVVHNRLEAADVWRFTPGQDFAQPVNLTWVDDTAFAIYAPSDSITSLTLEALACIIDTATEFGLSLSYGPGKTAVVTSFHGRGSIKARQTFESKFPHELPVLTEHQGLVPVPLTNHYRHLGGVVPRGGTLLPELKIRAALTQSRVKPFGRPTYWAASPPKRPPVHRTFGGWPAFSHLVCYEHQRFQSMAGFDFSAVLCTPTAWHRRVPATVWTCISSQRGNAHGTFAHFEDSSFDPHGAGWWRPHVWGHLVQPPSRRSQLMACESDAQLRMVERTDRSRKLECQPGPPHSPPSMEGSSAVSPRP